VGRSPCCACWCADCRPCCACCRAPNACHTQELLSLELYLSVEKGTPEWLELPDESHIFHKALYDGLNQAVQQLYAEAGRVLPDPGEVSGGMGGGGRLGGWLAPAAAGLSSTGCSLPLC
jgi:hypothetical protein